MIPAMIETAISARERRPFNVSRCGGLDRAPK
jgi:hypothetical protein